MKSVLCYGDSNTFGSIPGRPGTRYGFSDRWPGVLQDMLGREWLVIPEGLSGRTTSRDDPIEGAHLNGRTYLRPCLESHRPLDLIVIMLGTNDLKARFRSTAHDIGLGMAALVGDVREVAFRTSTEVPEIILVSPPPILRDLRTWDKVFEGGFEKSRNLASEYALVAKAQGVGFLNAGDHASCSPVDGFHIDNTGARSLGLAIGDLIGL
ncbi:SGNH/GDSL hydrolase family protein [Pararhizobium sp. IMCC21322]|uniref:SGNH/GDSL hydrolase family protein n=1 Tax=Pararhizobium sp. IMCC21322 TaxID=3067903 RepID=UPI002742182D|nr:SGNH/GDSL hydrolase family protein [Pararhizobium sp. IMCC21322]